MSERRLTWREWLWCKFHGICTKHGIDKELYSFDPESFYFDCPKCVEERESRYEEKHAAIMQKLAR